MGKFLESYTPSFFPSMHIYRMVGRSRRHSAGKWNSFCLSLSSGSCGLVARKDRSIISGLTTPITVTWAWFPGQGSLYYFSECRVCYASCLKGWRPKLYTLQSTQQHFLQYMTNGSKIHGRRPNAVSPSLQANCSWFRCNEKHRYNIQADVPLFQRKSTSIVL